MRTIAAVFVLFAILSTSQSSAETQRSDALQITAQKEAYILSVPVSRLVMLIPRGKLVPKKNPYGGGSSSPRYFYFVDRAFNVSGWFEPAQGFHGIKKFWRNEKKAWKQGGLPDPKNVIIKNIDGWKAIIYDISLPDGNNSHIRAHWVQAGTWIDVHLSMTSSHSNAELRSALESFLKAIVIKEYDQ